MQGKDFKTVTDYCTSREQETSSQPNDSLIKDENSEM